MTHPNRAVLPKPTDRLRLGHGGLRVSPICLGMTASPATVEAAYEAGVNFFFVSADLHWPLYEATRKGLERLLRGNRRRRDQIVVGVVSYFEEPWFGYLQFWEVIDAVPGLMRVDLLIAGGVSSSRSFDEREDVLRSARAQRYLGARAIGASLHQRKLAVRAEQNRVLDISYIRYNAGHPGARRDVFPQLRGKRRALLFNFKSMALQSSPGRSAKPVKSHGRWVPEPTDCYRFVLSAPEIDGLLCSLESPKELRALVDTLNKGPLSREEQDAMIRFCSRSGDIQDW
jgi:hypothetical protein